MAARTTVTGNLGSDAELRWTPSGSPLTPDADTPTGHAGNLRDELVQVAAMAVAWASTIREDQ